MTGGQRVSLFLAKVDHNNTIVNVIADNIENTGDFPWHVSSHSNVRGTMAIEIINGPASNVTTVRTDLKNYSASFELISNRTVTLTRKVKTSPKTLTILEVPTASKISSHITSNSLKPTTSTTTSTTVPIELQSHPVPVRLVIGIIFGGLALAIVVITFVYCFSRRWKRRFQLKRKAQEGEIKPSDTSYM